MGLLLGIVKFGWFKTFFFHGSWSSSTQSKKVETVVSSSITLHINESVVSGATICRA